MLDVIQLAARIIFCVFELAKSSSLRGYLWGWLDVHWLGREDVESLCTQEQVLQTLGLFSGGRYTQQTHVHACAHMLMCFHKDG